MFKQQWIYSKIESETSLSGIKLKKQIEGIAFSSYNSECSEDENNSTTESDKTLSYSPLEFNS